jgi:hypothetical protein
MLRALRANLAKCTVLAGVVAPGVLGHDTSACMLQPASLPLQSCLPEAAPAGFPRQQCPFLQPRNAEQCPAHCSAAPACLPARPPALCFPLAVPAVRGDVREVDNPERVGLVVSVLHLPPFSQVTATYMKDGLAPERPGAGERGVLRLGRQVFEVVCGMCLFTCCGLPCHPPACPLPFMSCLPRLPARLPAEWRSPEGDEVPKGGASPHCRTWLVLSDKHAHVGHLSKEVRACS